MEVVEEAFLEADYEEAENQLEVVEEAFLVADYEEAGNQWRKFDRVLEPSIQLGDLGVGALVVGLAVEFDAEWPGGESAVAVAVLEAEQHPNVG